MLKDPQNHHIHREKIKDPQVSYTQAKYRTPTKVLFDPVTKCKYPRPILLHCIQSLNVVTICHLSSIEVSWGHAY